jgi:hypothetical protein
VELRIGVADAYSGISNGTLSVKADFPVNGIAPNNELAGQGTFASSGVFTIPLDTPISTLSISHLTATVLDSQGNRTTVKVRFWVGPPDFRVLSINATRKEEGRLELHIDNPDALTGHTILWNDDPAAPSDGWHPLPVLDWSGEFNRTRRLEVSAPPNTDRGFLRVLAP